MKYQYPRLVFFFISFCLMSIYSCQNIKSGSSKEFSFEADESRINYDSLSLYNPFGLQLHPDTKYSIVTYINVSCPPCIGDIKEWKKLSKKLDTNNFEIKLVCYSNDYFEYFRYLCENNEIKPFVFLLDTTNTFAKKNPVFLNETSDKTVLTDAGSKVLLTGNPLHSKDVLVSFLKISQ